MTDTATEASANGTVTVPNGWTIRWLDHTWRSTETTTQQMCAVAETLGVWDWSISRPDTGPRQLATWIAILWAAEDDDLTVEQALLSVLAQPLAAVMAALTAGA